VRDDPALPAPAGSDVALAVLVGLVVLSPWPFGSVHLRTTQAIALVSLATALGAFAWDGWRGRGQLPLPPRALLWPLLGLWTLAVFQLVPLPEGLHHWLAPGSAAVWHPDVPAAAASSAPVRTPVRTPFRSTPRPRAAGWRSPPASSPWRWLLPPRFATDISRSALRSRS